MVSRDQEVNPMLGAQAPLVGRIWWFATAGVFLLALVANVPTAGDIGLTWDEPAYRYSQIVSAQWWEQLANCRSWADLGALLDPDSLIYYWPYGRNGINLHPPLAGQVSLLTHALFRRWVRDIPSRRLASVFEFSLSLTILFGFLARRYGPWVGGVAAGALLLMPRVYGDGHIAGTDMPALLLWGATAVAFWNALHAARGQWWRMAVGGLLGLCFVEKMASVTVVLPLLGWLAVVHGPRAFSRRGGLALWIDGLVTTAALVAPLLLALSELVRLARLLPPPGQTDLFSHRPPSILPGAILACPLAIWAIRRILFKMRRGDRVWGVERPALETWTAMVAIAPFVAWIGNPLWWRETLPRLAHYLMLNAARRGALPDIPTFYRGQTYLYSLPWENAWVLIAVTVPASILVAAMGGIVYAVRSIRSDQIPIYFLVHLLTLPVIRMLGTPAHDGVRLFLPTFFFLAAMAGWGTAWAGDGLQRLTKRRTKVWTWVVTIMVLAPPAWQLVRIHPYELSYFNELIGGPVGAVRAGFELTYWYDPFTAHVIGEINERLPPGASVDFLNPMAKSETFAELQSLGELRGDIRLWSPKSNQFPFVWLLTQHSKATAFTRLLYAMKPWYESRPPQLDGLRVASVADPVAVSRAWALQLLLDAPSGGGPEISDAPKSVLTYAPWLAWLWGNSVPKAKRINIFKRSLDWATTDPEGLRSAARSIISGSAVPDANEARLLAILKRHDPLDAPNGLSSERLLRGRPQALLEAVEMLINRSDDLRTVLSRYPYTSADAIAGFLDRRLP
jgi:hypothetical protein